MIKSKEQERAKKAWELANSVSVGIIDKYSSLAKSAPVMILTNGLGQTLAFFISKSNGKNEYTLLYRHINEWLDDNISWTPNNEIGNDLIEKVINEKSQIYRMVTEETLAFLSWIKRFATALTPDTKEAAE
ncbi:MAG: type III-B CRISPR module-associated protein Cmr5 [Nitrospirae bacterium]|nr:type III-B CRISPR module-associated protein Cmr5 [Nitrospirota bacterium]